MGVTSNSILLMLSIILTIMSAYASLDLFYLLKSSEHKKRLLFLGSAFSMGIGIWVMNFFGVLSKTMNSSQGFHLPIVLLSMILGISFTGIAFYTITRQSLKPTNVILAGFFMTLSVTSSYVISMYSTNFKIHYNEILLAFSALFVFGGFLFSFWMLFYTKSISPANQVWLKPIGALIIAATIVQGHFLLIRSSLFEINNQAGSNPAALETFIIYLILLASIIILGGLISTSALLSKRLAATYTNLKDITAALDEHSIVAITDTKGQIKFVNEKFIEISKYSAAELIGKDHTILNSGYHSKEFFKDLWATIGSGKVWKGEIQNKAKDGTFYWVNTTIVPFLNKKGKPYQYVSIRTDITDKKQAELSLKNSLKELSDVKFALDQSSIVAFTDEKGKITNVNDKLCHISQYDREELIGQDH